MLGLSPGKHTNIPPRVNRPTTFHQAFPGSVFAEISGKNEHAMLKNGEEYLKYGWKLPYFENLRYLQIISTYEAAIDCFHVMILSFLWRKLEAPMNLQPPQITYHKRLGFTPSPNGSCFLVLAHSKFFFGFIDAISISTSYSMLYPRNPV